MRVSAVMRIHDENAEELAPIGSRWKTDVGTIWRVTNHLRNETGLYIKLIRENSTNDTYVWHVSSLTMTTAVRIS